MRTIRLLKPKQFEQQEIAEPAAPGAGEALVRVHHMGICGSDFSGYLGKMPFFSYPRIPGHELGVEVLAVGPGVTEVRVGDPTSTAKIARPASGAGATAVKTCRCWECIPMAACGPGWFCPHASYTRATG